jgi:DnaJ-class molecular chaperone
MTNLELEFNAWGTGAAHAAAWTEQVGRICDQCHGRKMIGPPRLSACCPKCEGSGRMEQPA